jgi:hypothetical protein
VIGISDVAFVVLLKLSLSVHVTAYSEFSSIVSMVYHKQYPDGGLPSGVFDGVGVLVGVTVGVRVLVGVKVGVTVLVGVTLYVGVTVGVGVGVGVKVGVGGVPDSQSEHLKSTYDI